MQVIDVVNGKWVMTFISDTTLLETGQLEICDESDAKDEDEALECLNEKHYKPNIFDAQDFVENY